MAGPEITIVEEGLPLTATEVVVPALELEVDAFFNATIGTSAGTSSPSDRTGMGDPVETKTSYEETSRIFVEVPEPVAGLRVITALLTLVALRGHRVGRM